MQQKNKILFIGSNDMCEINSYLRYDEGYFIEAIPEIYKKLNLNLEAANKEHKKSFKALNYLITNKEEENHDFYLYNHIHGASSSIYKVAGVSDEQLKDFRKVEDLSRASDDIIAEDHSVTKKQEKRVYHGGLEFFGTIQLPSKRVATLIESLNINIKEYDVFLDCQGAELEVLKSFDAHLLNVDWLQTEITTINSTYENGVVFEDLNLFLNQHGLFTDHTFAHSGWVHTDAVFTRK